VPLTPDRKQFSSGVAPPRDQSCIDRRVNPHDSARTPESSVAKSTVDGPRLLTGGSTWDPDAPVSAAEYGLQSERIPSAPEPCNEPPTTTRLSGVELTASPADAVAFRFKTVGAHVPPNWLVAQTAINE